MPKGLVNLMTHAEFLDLVRFLSELGKPGPYAIRTTPTIQRWRVLKAGPAGAGRPPSRTTGALRDQVLGAAPDRWATVYAKVAGSLPLDDAAAASGGKVLYLQGELDVTAPGPIRISPAFPEGIRFWVDDIAAPAGTREFTAMRDARPPCRDPPRRHCRTFAPRAEVQRRQAGRLHGRVHRRRRQVNRPPRMPGGTHNDAACARKDATPLETSPAEAAASGSRTRSAKPGQPEQPPWRRPPPR